MSLPVGIIALWRGSIATIPTGWNLCDGTNGTPDLRDLFILGAGSTYNPGDTGGSATHTHTGTTDGHTHTISGPPDFWQSGAGFDNQTASSTVPFTTDPANNLPPFYSLAYIMRI